MFNNIKYILSPSENGYEYPTKQRRDFVPFSSQTELNFGARYYDSRIGRWSTTRLVEMSVDPLAEKYPGWSPYAYCLDNPLKFIDPNGKAVYYTNKKLEKLFQNMAQQSKEVALVLGMYSQKDQNGKNIGPDLFVSSGKLGKVNDNNGKPREKYGETTPQIDKNKNELKQTDITIDLQKAEKKGVDIMRVAAHELGHAYEAVYDPERMLILIEQEMKEKTNYDDRQTEKDAKTKETQIMNEIEKNKNDEEKKGN